MTLGEGREVRIDMEELAQHTSDAPRSVPTFEGYEHDMWPEIQTRDGITFRSWSEDLMGHGLRYQY